MEIFTYTPNWEAIKRRTSMRMKESNDTAQRLRLNNDRFYYKEEKKNKQTESTLCSICKKGAHLLSICPERKTEKTEKKEESIYVPSFKFTPTTVKLTNVPLDTTRAQVRETLLSNNIQYDILTLLTDKIDREEFKGIIYIELPTEGVAEKCVELFDRMKMGVQIVGASIVESKRIYK